MLSGTGRRERVNQKYRTRLAIVQAAVQLVAEGRAPTVAEAADAALVSRTTAYRYFPNQESLLQEAAVPSWPGAAKCLEAFAGAEDPAARIEYAAEQVLRLVLRDEVVIRTIIKLSLERWLEGEAGQEEALAMRPGQRLTWIGEALGDLPGVDHCTRLRLLQALSVLIGSEAIIVLRDVCGLTPEETIQVVRWASRTLVEATLNR